MIKKIPTSCCALAQLTCGNGDSYESLQAKITQLKEEADVQNYYNTPTGDGQRAVFVITTPTEEQLVTNLQRLGFERVYTFKRRKGYPAGMLIQWQLSW